MSSMISSNKKRGFSRRRLAIHGRPGAGKTWAAATLAKNCPKYAGRNKKSKWVKLDALWVSADTNATIGFMAKHIEVPEIDLAAELAAAPAEVLSILNDTADEIYNYVDKNKPSLVVVDTASKIDKAVARYWEDNAPTTKAGKRDSFAIWRNVVATHERFHGDMDALPCDVIFLMHSKPRSESESSEKKARSQAVAGQYSDIKFDFMYEDAANIYRRDCDFIFVVDYAIKNGKKERWLYSEAKPASGFETKNRFQDDVKEQEAVDLGAIFKRITE